MRSFTSIALALVLTTLASQGQISFGPSQEISNFLNRPRDARAVDMDGDGDLDVISREGVAVKVIWWENDGEGNFPERHVWTWGDVKFWVVGLEDADADGRPDVWIRKWISDSNEPPYARTVRYLVALGDQHGGFGEPQAVKDFHYQDDSQNTSVRVVDMNHDGRADLLMNDGVWMRQTDGSFLPPPAGTFYPGTNIDNLGEELASEADRLLAIDDFDGDGDPDLAFGAPGLMISFNLGEGLLGTPISAGFMRPNEKVDYLRSVPPAAGETRARLFVAASLQYPASPVPAPRLALGAFSSAGEYTAAAVEPIANGLNALTWDAGSNRAIVASYAPATVHSLSPLDVAAFALSSTGDEFIKTPLFQTDGSVDSLSMADLNGDGAIDLLFPLSAPEGTWGNFPSELRWYRRGGADEFIQHQPSISQLATEGTIVYAGDVDGDGDEDIITADSQRNFSSPTINSYGYLQIILWENEGGGASFKRRVLAEGPDAMDVIAVSDYDNDGDLDLLVQTYDILGTSAGANGQESYGTFRLVWLVQGEGGVFSESIKYEGTGKGLLESAKYLDWDGLPQLPGGPALPDVVGISMQRRPVYFKGTDTGFQAMQDISAEDEVYFGSWNDLDQDGDADFSWFAPPMLTESFWLRNESGVAGSKEPLPPAHYPLGSDIDGDGFNDAMGNRVILLARPAFSSEVIPLPDDFNDFGIFEGFVDLDSDGDMDLLVPMPTQGFTSFATLIWCENSGEGFRQSQLVADGISHPRNEYSMADIDGDGLKDLVVQSNGWNPRLEWFKVTKRQAPAGFSNWIAPTGLKGNLAGPLSDGDEDGINNWEEFVFGSDPAAVDIGHPSRPRLEKQGNAWAYSYQRRIGLASPPKVQTSTDLKIWNDVTSAAPSAQPAAPGYEWISEVSGGEDALFFRTVIPNP